WKGPVHLGPAEGFVLVRVSDAAHKKCEQAFTIRLDKESAPALIQTKFPFSAPTLSAGSGRMAAWTPQGIKVWNLQTGEEIANLKQPGTNQFVLSDNGERLAAQTPQGIKVW